MTPDNVVSIAFVFALIGAVLLKAARDVLYEAHQLVDEAVQHLPESGFRVNVKRSGPKAKDFT